jgi:rRNA-processing protein FCF1
MTGAQNPTHAYLDVTRVSDGRYCVAFVRGEFNRRSYTPSAEQVIVQAQRAGSIAVRTDDADLRRRCEEAGVTLLELGVEG